MKSAGMKRIRVQRGRARGTVQVQPEKRVLGKPWRQICMAVPEDELEQIDLIAATLKVSRSRLFREAVLNREELKRLLAVAA